MHDAPRGGASRPICSGGPDTLSQGRAARGSRTLPASDPMAVVLDLLRNDQRPRHPEKAHRPDQPILRKPDWIRVKAPTHPTYHETRKLMRDNNLVTVCEEAACPNIGECWSQRHATMMIMGDTCTRACAFCNVRTGLPDALDADEPNRVADAVAPPPRASALRWPQAADRP